MKLRPKGREQRVDSRSGYLYVGLQRFRGAEHGQPLADSRHDAIQQQVIETQRVGQGVAETRRVFDIE